MKMVRNDEYHFGLWTTNLGDTLLWVPSRVELEVSCADVPSWSWASRMGAVDFNLELLEPVSHRAYRIDDSGILSTYATLRLLEKGKCMFFKTIQGGGFSDWGYWDKKRQGLHLLMDDLGEEFGWARLDNGNSEESDFEGVALMPLGPNRDMLQSTRARSWVHVARFSIEEFARIDALTPCQYCLLIQHVPTTQSLDEWELP